MVIDHAFLMQLALNEAWRYQGQTYPNPAVGALLLDGNGQILSIEAHHKAGDPHAEVNTLKMGFLKLSTNPILSARLEPLTDSHAIHDFLTVHHQNIFKSCTLYVTLEPCAHYGKTPPCSQLIASLGIQKVVIGSSDPNNAAAGGADYLKKKGIDVTMHVCKEACDSLIEPFRLWQEGRFVFFKHAQRLNGTIDGGYISAPESLDLVHTFRDRIDLIVIGGNTVRTDRPTLDARRIGGKAPDVLIYSRRKDFDPSIPLFSVPGRNVYIEATLDRIKSCRFVMIEGGGAMYRSVKAVIDWHLSLVSPVMGPGLGFDADQREQIIYSCRMGEDLLVWSRKISE